MPVRKDRVSITSGEAVINDIFLTQVCHWSAAWLRDEWISADSINARSPPQD